MSLLEVNNLSLSFGGLKALDNVSLYVNEGEIVSLIGPNGAGKTTFFNILTGIYKTAGGEIIFDGKDITNKTPHDIVKAGIARTFQNIRLFRGARVIENVLLGAHIKTPYNFWSAVFRTKRFKQIEKQNARNALRLLENVGLSARVHDFAANLPYGEQRKLEIARALASGAKLILLDEPAAGMNPKESDELLQFIGRLRDAGFTILMIEHDMNVVMNISERVYVFDYGKVISSGTPADVVNDRRVIEAYLGVPLNDVFYDGL